MPVSGADVDNQVTVLVLLVVIEPVAEKIISWVESFLRKDEVVSIYGREFEGDVLLVSALTLSYTLHCHVETGEFLRVRFVPVVHGSSPAEMGMKSASFGVEM